METELGTIATRKSSFQVHQKGEETILTQGSGLVWTVDQEAGHPATWAPGTRLNILLVEEGPRTVTKKIILDKVDII
jgi:hypothetical protein